MAGEIIGKVQSLQGIVEVRGANGKMRLLAVGDELREGDTVMTTGGGGKLVIQLADGGVVSIGSGQTVAMTSELSASRFPDADEAQLASVDKVIQAIRDDNSDLDKLLEPTAAGPAGARGDEGHTFVQLLRIVENVDSVRGPTTVGLTNDGSDFNRITPLIFEAENSPPVAVDDAVETLEDTPITIDVRANDSDVDGDTLTVIAVTDGTNGMVTIDPVTGNPVYVPNPDFSGTDTFTYTISDGNGGTSTATVTVTVTPVDDSFTDADEVASTAEDTVLSGSVLSGTSSVDGPVTVTGFTVAGDATLYAAGQSASIAGVGTLQINGDGSYTFTPASGYNGPVPVATYTLTDGSSGDTSTLTITVTPVDDSFTDADEVASTAEDTVLTGSVLSGTSSVDGPVTVASFTVAGVAGTFNAGQSASIAGVGTLQINGDGSYTFTPASDFNGPVPVATYTLTDGSSGDTSTLTITVTPVDDPSVLAPDTNTTQEDTAVSGNVLTNDSDLDNSLSVSSFTVAGVAGTFNAGQTANIAGVGTLQISSNGNYTFTPALNFNGTVPTTTYTTNTGSSTTLDITVTPVNDVPVVRDENARVSEEGLPGGLPDSSGQNDTTNSRTTTGTVSITDADNDSITSVTLTAPPDGALTSNGMAVEWSGSGTDRLVATADGVTIATVTINESGRYTFTLQGPLDHAGTSSEDTLDVAFGVVATDATGATGAGSLVITVEDDRPVAQPAQSFTQGLTNTNILLILDTSGSMSRDSGIAGLTRLEAAVESIRQLLAAYDNLGDVNVRLVTFARDGTPIGTEWTDIQTAVQQLEGLVANGGTNYDQGLQAAMDAFNSDGALDNAQNVSYFFSDGLPTRPLGGAGIDAQEEAEWIDFLNENGIQSYSIGLGNEVRQGALDPIAYDGQSSQNTNAVVVDDFRQLTSVITGTVPEPVRGNLLITGPDLATGAGADGGFVRSVVIDGTTYLFNPTANGGEGGLLVTGGEDRGDFNRNTHELSVTTELGGTWVIDLDSGEYLYNAASTTSALGTERLDYTIADNDGDRDSSSLTVNVSQSTVTTGNENDNTLNGNAGPDLILGQGGDDTIDGNGGNDTLSGGAGSDTIFGGAGQDAIIGGRGDDTLTGNADSDVFVWRLTDRGNGMGGSATRDVVTDFNAAPVTGGGDALDLRDLLQGENYNSLANLDNYLHFTQVGDSTVVQISSTGGFAGGFDAGAVDQRIQLNGVDLTAGGTMADQQIIQTLLDGGKLVRD
ncbi:MAG: retention module-containing protein [Panacagrimonas sp.]